MLYVFNHSAVSLILDYILLYSCRHAYKSMKVQKCIGIPDWKGLTSKVVTRANSAISHKLISRRSLGYECLLSTTQVEKIK